MDLIILITSIVICIVCVLMTVSLYLVYKDMSSFITPTYSLREMDKENKTLLLHVMKQTGLMDDAVKFCTVTENGVFTKFTKETYEKKLKFRRQLKFYISALLVGLVTAFIFKSVLLTFSIVFFLFSASLLDGFLVKILVNNMTLLMDV